MCQPLQKFLGRRDDGQGQSVHKCLKHLKRAATIGRSSAFGWPSNVTKRNPRTPLKSWCAWTMKHPCTNSIHYWRAWISRSTSPPNCYTNLNFAWLYFVASAALSGKPYNQHVSKVNNYHRMPQYLNRLTQNEWLRNTFCLLCSILYMYIYIYK